MCSEPSGFYQESTKPLGQALTYRMKTLCLCVILLYGTSLVSGGQTGTGRSKLGHLSHVVRDSFRHLPTAWRMKHIFMNPGQNSGLEEAVMRPGRIVGGEVVARGSRPWMSVMANINDGGSVSLCGATLIHPQWVLTAAHCIFEGVHPHVLIGEHDLWNGRDHTLRRASQEIVHPDYTNNLTQGIIHHDLALVKLNEPVDTSVSHIATLPLASDESSSQPGTVCETAGWGHEVYDGSESQYLKAVPVEIEETATCIHNYTENTFKNDTQLCAGEMGSSSCNGDSGGPLVCPNSANEPTLTGVVSYGVRCGARNFPAGYTKVLPFINWICSTTNNAIGVCNH